MIDDTPYLLQWRHNEHNGVSNQQRLDCLLNRLFWQDQRKHQRSASLAFVRGIHRSPVNSPHKGPVTRKMFSVDDVMFSWEYKYTYWNWLNIILLVNARKKRLWSISHFSMNLALFYDWEFMALTFYLIVVVYRYMCRRKLFNWHGFANLQTSDCMCSYISSEQLNHTLFVACEWNGSYAQNLEYQCGNEIKVKVDGDGVVRLWF